ncbi:DUF2514 family protein [Cupriavidus alkaliphilus]|uniref:DUF2514 family protein n=1 Tax=Cupriavidus alkaliphilus TaxID=942866 RepID=UPI0038B3080E
MAKCRGKRGTRKSLDVLADVLSRAHQRVGELAEYADRARIAGLARERAYEALTLAP